MNLEELSGCLLPGRWNLGPNPGGPLMGSRAEHRSRAVARLQGPSSPVTDRGLWVLGHSGDGLGGPSS